MKSKFSKKTFDLVEFKTFKKIAATEFNLMFGELFDL